MSTASKKQVDYAKKIALKLRIPLPEETTAYAYWHFIDKHKIDYEYVMQKEFYETYGEEIGDCYCESWFC